MRRIFAAIFLMLPGLAAAQDAPAKTDEVPDLATLLATGFEIKGMVYLESGLLFALQRGAAAVVCETTVNGKNKLCIRLK